MFASQALRAKGSVGIGDNSSSSSSCFAEMSLGQLSASSFSPSPVMCPGGRGNTHIKDR